jgi:hypothetical protein
MDRTAKYDELLKKIVPTVKQNFLFLRTLTGMQGELNSFTL